MAKKCRAVPGYAHTPYSQKDLAYKLFLCCHAICSVTRYRLIGRIPSYVFYVLSLVFAILRQFVL